MKRNLFKTVFTLLLVSSICEVSSAQAVKVDINLDVKHRVGDVSSFDRKKFISLHADIEEFEWDGNNFTNDLRNDFLNGYDVYLGRNTGGVQWNMNGVVVEDPNRRGYAKPSSISSSGRNVKQSYGSKTEYHRYESRNDQVLCAQLHPFYPDGKKTNKGWAFSQADNGSERFGTASGEYFGRYIKEHFGNGATTGKPRPKYIEVINEPIWHLTDFGNVAPAKVFRFHNAVATQIRKYNPGSNLKIGGFCTAFPDFEKRNFEQWKERWKLFMDIAGANMDYWTIHLYDFPAINNGKQKYRKGSNMEATFDMMEQYSYMKFRKVKPIMISEFGAQMHDYFGAWSPYRDWLHLKSVNSMLMQFMERANLINKAINFLPIKAEWGTKGHTNTYNHRLLRKKNEPASYTGEWVYTDMLKTYELWSDVKGVRVDSKSTNPDIMTDVYVDGKKTYVILNILDFKPFDIDLDLLGTSLKPQSIKVKHLYLYDKKPRLDVYMADKTKTKFTIGPEATIILEYTYSNKLVINQTSSEAKHYATSYFKQIKANQITAFEINGINKSQHGEAVLRLGVGRAHGKSLHPTITINGKNIQVSTNFRGGNQKDRDSFFGVLEIEVPYAILKAKNNISVKFPDNGGHISSVAMQVFNFSRKIERSNNAGIKSLVIEAEKFTNTSGTINDKVVPYGVRNLGQKIGYVNKNDWATYDITIADAGVYQVKYLIATKMKAAVIELQVDERKVSTDNVTTTTSWDDFRALNSTSKIELSAGKHTLKIVGAGQETWQWDLDKIELTKIGEIATGASIVLQTEEFLNTGGDYNDGTVPNGINKSGEIVNFVNKGDWATYDINEKQTGDYKIVYRAAAPSNNAHVKIEVAGKTLFTKLANTATWEEYKNNEAPKTIFLEKGKHRVKLTASGSEPWQWNMDKVTFVKTNTKKTGEITQLVKTTSVVDLFPNPTTNTINISGLEKSKYDVRLLDLRGRLLRQESINVDGMLVLSVEDLPKGIYLLNLKNKQQEETLQFMKR